MNLARKDLILLLAKREVPANPVVTIEVARDETLEMTTTDLVHYLTWVGTLPISDVGRRYNALTDQGRAFFRDAVLEGTSPARAADDAKHSYGLRTRR